MKITPEKLLHKKSVLRTEEFEVRDINSDGDATDVKHTISLDEAKRWMNERLTEDTVARVLQFHRSYLPARESDLKTLKITETDEVKNLETIGDKEALKAGGWLD